MTTATKLSTAKMNFALKTVAAWMGPWLNGTAEPAPTGEDAAYNGTGPVLYSDWTFRDIGGPAIVMETSEDWVFDFLEKNAAVLDARGIFAEPYSGWALCLYVA